MARLLLFNKPCGVLSQFTDRRSACSPRATLSDYVGVAGVYPAGRLDRDSEGLLLLTDDGKLQDRIASPRFKAEKTYLVQVEGMPDAPALDALRRGARSTRLICGRAIHRCDTANRCLTAGWKSPSPRGATGRCGE
jgi:23S rRNA pseudouridine2457 synthase